MIKASWRRHKPLCMQHVVYTLPIHLKQKQKPKKKQQQQQQISQTLTLETDVSIKFMVLLKV